MASRKALMGSAVKGLKTKQSNSWAISESNITQIVYH